MGKGALSRSTAVLGALLAASFAPAWAVEPPGTPSTVAFVGATVVPMTHERVLRERTVLVRDGRIAAIGPRDHVRVPDDALRVDAAGRHLMPGLAEMHAHVPVERPYRDEVLLLYAARGVTTIRGMLGHPTHLRLRSELAAHRVLGPRLYTSGPSFNGDTVDGAEAARGRVQEQAAAGYDFLKIHPGLTRAELEAVAAAAEATGMSFEGHVTAEVGLRGCLALGQRAIDHLDGYVRALLPAEKRPGEASLFGFGVAHRADPAGIPELVRATRTAGAAVVPTQTLLENLATPKGGAELADARPQLRFVPPRLRAEYIARKDGLLEQTSEDVMARAEDYLELRRRLIRALHDGGVDVLLGSDAPRVFNVPGFSAHRELAAMVRAGRSPYEALRAGTALAARFFGAEGRFGTVTVGAAADLVLVEGNPLDDIAAAGAIQGVMVRGRWLDADWIDRQLGALAARYAESR